MATLTQNLTNELIYQADIINDYQDKSTKEDGTFYTVTEYKAAKARWNRINNIFIGRSK